ncbi:MAG: hypothetical protein JNJ86_16650 [Chitinophagaceae bacterium]|nr:hypothetical protein [Chitinophagaceae bacterium]
MADMLSSAIKYWQMIYFLHSHSNFGLTSFIPILAFIVSVTALYFSVRFSRRNIQLSIQQAILKTVSEKARDCNQLWESEPANEMQNPNSPHFKIMSELIITTEIIDRAFDLFGKNNSAIMKFKEDYYYLFWKQLRTDLRGWVRRTPQIAEQLQPQNIYYSQQVVDLHNRVQAHFEQVL